MCKYALCITIIKGLFYKSTIKCHSIVNIITHNGNVGNIIITHVYILINMSILLSYLIEIVLKLPISIIFHLIYFYFCHILSRLVSFYKSKSYLYIQIVPTLIENPQIVSYFPFQPNPQQSFIVLNEYTAH